MRQFTFAALALVALAGTAAAQTTAGVVGGRLTLTTNNTDQNVKVEMKEGLGIARVFGFQGIADGTAYTGVSAVTVNTGSGFDKVEFDIESRQSLDIRINTGTGALESKAQWKILSTTSPVSAAVTYTGAANPLSKVEVSFDNETNNASVSLDTGNNQEVTAKVLSDDLSNSLAATFNARAAKTGFELASNALTLDVTLRGTHATNFSEVGHVINQLRPASVRVQNDVTLSAGDDKHELKIGAPGSVTTVLGTIRGQAGNDNILVEAQGDSVINGLTLDGGAGDDFLSNQTKGWFQLSQTVGANIFGGSGNDFLILTTDTGIRGTGLPNDVQNIIDGGEGFDLYNAFGFIRNCEGRL
jgi:hypothetical protein